MSSAMGAKHSNETSNWNGFWKRVGLSSTETFVTCTQLMGGSGAVVRRCSPLDASAEVLPPFSTKGPLFPYMGPELVELAYMYEEAAVFTPATALRGDYRRQPFRAMPARARENFLSC